MIFELKQRNPKQHNQGKSCSHWQELDRGAQHAVDFH